MPITEENYQKAEDLLARESMNPNADQTKVAALRQNLAAFHQSRQPSGAIAPPPEPQRPNTSFGGYFQEPSVETFRADIARPEVQERLGFNMTAQPGTASVAGDYLANKVPELKGYTDVSRITPAVANELDVNSPEYKAYAEELYQSAHEKDPSLKRYKDVSFAKNPFDATVGGILKYGPALTEGVGKTLAPGIRLAKHGQRLKSVNQQYAAAAGDASQEPVGDESDMLHRATDVAENTVPGAVEAGQFAGYALPFAPVNAGTNALLNATNFAERGLIPRLAIGTGVGAVGAGGEGMVRYAGEHPEATLGENFDANIPNFTGGALGGLGGQILAEVASGYRKAFREAPRNQDVHVLRSAGGDTAMLPGVTAPKGIRENVSNSVAQTPTGGETRQAVDFAAEKVAPAMQQHLENEARELHKKASEETRRYVAYLDSKGETKSTRPIVDEVLAMFRGGAYESPITAELRHGNPDVVNTFRKVLLNNSEIAHVAPQEAARMAAQRNGVVISEKELQALGIASEPGKSAVLVPGDIKPGALLEMEDMIDEKLKMAGTPGGINNPVWKRINRAVKSIRDQFGVDAPAAHIPGEPFRPASEPSGPAVNVQGRPVDVTGPARPEAEPGIGPFHKRTDFMDPGVPFEEANDMQRQQIVNLGQPQGVGVNLPRGPEAAPGVGNQRKFADPMNPTGAHAMRPDVPRVFTPEGEVPHPALQRQGWREMRQSAAPEVQQWSPLENNPLDIQRAKAAESTSAESLSPEEAQSLPPENVSRRGGFLDMEPVQRYPRSGVNESSYYPGKYGDEYGPMTRSQQINEVEAQQEARSLENERLQNELWRRDQENRTPSEMDLERIAEINKYRSSFLDRNPNFDPNAPDARDIVGNGYEPASTPAPSSPHPSQFPQSPPYQRETMISPDQHKEYYDTRRDVRDREAAQFMSDMETEKHFAAQRAADKRTAALRDEFPEAEYPATPRPDIDAQDKVNAEGRRAFARARAEARDTQVDYQDKNFLSPKDTPERRAGLRETVSDAEDISVPEYQSEGPSIYTSAKQPPVSAERPKSLFPEVEDQAGAPSRRDLTAKYEEPNVGEVKNIIKQTDSKADALTPQELDAVHSYTQRHGDKVGSPEWESAIQKLTIDNPTRGGSLYHGTRIPQEKINEILHTGKFDISTPKSTSYNRGVASSMAYSRAKRGEPVIFQINEIDDGISLASKKLGIAGSSNEREILLKDKNFEVAGSHRDHEGNLVIELKQRRPVPEATLDDGTKVRGLSAVQRNQSLAQKRLDESTQATGANSYDSIRRKIIDFAQKAGNTRQDQELLELAKKLGLEKELREVAGTNAYRRIRDKNIGVSGERVANAVATRADALARLFTGNARNPLAPNPVTATDQIKQYLFHNTIGDMLDLRGGRAAAKYGNEITGNVLDLRGTSLDEKDNQ